MTPRAGSEAARAHEEAPIDIARPVLGEEEKRAVLEVLSSFELTKGARVAAFERAFADYHGARHGVATSSGAAALTATLLAHGIGDGDEVIVPSFGFFATAAAVLGVGARPVFADIERASLCLCPDAAERAITPRTRAIMPVHLFGLPAEMSRFSALCARHDLVLLEDAAQAHGAVVDGCHVGSFGTAAFSFYATKNMTTMEGGMVLTNDADVARRLRLVRNHGRSGAGDHELVGSNFRMTEVAAAIGLIQLGRLDAWTRARRENAHYYDAHFEGVVIPPTYPTREHVYHHYTVRLAEGCDRARVLSSLRARSIEARAYYSTPIHRQPALAGRLTGRPPDLRETESASRSTLSVPVHPGLEAADRERIVEVTNEAVARYGA